MGYFRPARERRKERGKRLKRAEMAETRAAAEAKEGSDDIGTFFRIVAHMSARMREIFYA